MAGSFVLWTSFFIFCRSWLYEEKLKCVASLHGVKPLGKGLTKLGQVSYLLLWVLLLVMLPSLSATLHIKHSKVFFSLYLKAPPKMEDLFISWRTIPLITHRHSTIWIKKIFAALLWGRPAPTGLHTTFRAYKYGYHLEAYGPENRSGPG